MTISPDQFRYQCGKCIWIFDLFAHGFDFLNGRFYPRSDPALEHVWEAEQENISRYDIENQIVNADGIFPEIVRTYLDIPGDDADMEAPEFCIRLFSILSAIDRAVSGLNYLGAYLHLGARRWSNTNDYFERNKQLQRDASGHVVFKPRYFKQAPSQIWLDQALEDEKTWKKIPRRGEELDNYFENLLRLVPPEDCGVTFRVLRGNQDFHTLDWTSFKVGIVPLIEELRVRGSSAQLLPGPLVIKKETATPATFGIHIEDPSKEVLLDLCHRAEVGLRHLAENGCQIVLFPEMVVPDFLVGHLKKVLKELAIHDQPRPGLLLAGTFTRFVHKYSPNLPFNVAIVLGNDGEELWRQRKMQPYDMKLHEQQNFGLESVLKSESCRENIAFENRELCVVDSPATGLRMVVLICEDATRDPGLRCVRLLNPTLILAPVMAGPLDSSGGFGNSVSKTLQETPGIFVVANSAALARAAWGTRLGAPPLGIVGLPLLNVSENHRPLVALRELRKISGSSSVEVLIFQFPT
ncbi:MAG: hypothetical protein DMG65_15920 [Candidatus Angelobacter sp. Gp1-AA117]|nr:MAG: hypothetical protein DMG65_15920 [Candidatus Angelobacter sp. Gp1-AA117]